MQQIARIQQGDAVIPALVSDAGLLDLRPLVPDITPETVASGVLTKVNAATLKSLSGDVRYLAPISGIRQIPATGFNYKKHIEEVKVPVPTEPEVFLKSMLSHRTFRSHQPRPQSGRQAGLGNRTWDCCRPRSAGHHGRGGSCVHLWLRLPQRCLRSVNSDRCAETNPEVAADVLSDRAVSDYGH